ncbi:ataxin-1 isoform X2 [Esox lucius]|uniref:ataxin-1 isoform X2 n=1 Tax=Esox lucius TaxID=8010 RepID=UPI0014773A8A|nr:ataxin-1 isoform X2 [Esox lucius]
MKSNQERSNGCLPPKKREILALEQRPVAAAASSDDTLHTENLAWLASVASECCRSSETPSPGSQVPSSSSSFSSPCATSLSAIPLSCLPTVYPTAVGLTQHGGTIQYAQLAPNLQFISSGPYTGYISSQVIPSSAASMVPSVGQQRPHLEGHCYPAALISQPSKDQQQLQIGLPSDLAVSLPSSTHVTGTQQFIQLDAPLTVTSSRQAHLQPFQLHPHTGMGVLPHTLTLAPSQVLVQYADGSGLNKTEGGHTKVVQLNGELERSFGKQSVGGIKGISSNHNSQHGYETRHILLPADYTTQDSTGLQTSLLLVANNNSTTNVAEHNKVQVPQSLMHSDKAGTCPAKLVSRNCSFNSLNSPEALKVSSVPHTVIQTTQHSEDPVRGLFSSAQAPIIGYIANAGHRHGISYAALPQHLVIQGGQSLLIPVSGAGCVNVATAATDLEASSCVATTTTTTAHLAPAPPPMPRQAYLTAALSKCEAPGSEGRRQSPAVLQAQVLPMQQIQTSSPTPAPVPAAPSPASPPSSLATLPPFFMRGSIIQLADGELKRVEDLKTEDFIQSAEISSELKIDSSTVERIDTGQTPNVVVIQFGVGELKAQVSVEVLMEYPFFVFGQGWSSCCPDRTTRLFELSCAKLCVGDVCVSLTLRSLGGVSGSNSDGSHGVEAKQRHGHTAVEPVAQSPNSQTDSHLGISQTDSHLGISQTDSHLGISQTDSHLGISQTDSHLGISQTDSHLCISQTDSYLGISQSSTPCISQSDNPGITQNNSQCISQSISWSNSSQVNSQRMDKDMTDNIKAAGSNSSFLVRIAKTDELSEEVRSAPRFVELVTRSGLKSSPGLRPGSGSWVYRVEVGPKGNSDLLAYSGTGEMSETTENGEKRERELNSQMLPLPPSKTERGDMRSGRKRRWSAPERDQTKRTDEELPLTLPKLYFVSQEVKLSIEGRSNIGR